jgi:proprotein convertase subtilisin/kexin type 5
LCLKCNQQNDCSHCKKNAYSNEQNVCECRKGYKYNQIIDECEPICPIGKYFNLSFNHCEACAQGCKLCDDQSTCLKCAKDGLLIGSSCQCRNGYYLNETINRCLKVENSNINNKKASLYKNFFKETCGEYTLCKKCDSGCSGCKQNAIFIPENRNCSCEQGFYYSRENDECTKCHPLCKTCFGPSNIECFTCNRNRSIVYIEENNECRCKEPLVLDFISNLCTNKSAAKHDKSFILKKLVSSSTYLANSSSNCEKGYRLNVITKKCEGIF